MATSVTAPDPLMLLPPLLAYLPTSFASSRPPPDLVPLLSPILRQRIHIHTSSSTSAHESWLRLLCWDSAKADRLSDTVEHANFEPHPVSGEVEVGEVDPITYKRSDSETLKAHIPLSDWSLSAIYLWCTGGDGGDGWKLTELFALDLDLLKDPTWFKSIEDAENAARVIAVEQNRRMTRSATSERIPGLTGEGDDDDYWAMYDNTPAGRTPARKHPFNPRGSTLSNEDDYFAQYGDVQPALDGHDPDEEHENMGQVGLNGNVLQEVLAQSSGPHASTTVHGGLPTHKEEDEDEQSIPVRQPSPSSPRSRAGSDTVERLEHQAERSSISEIGIRHHIGYSIKSMFRLAKSAGIGRQDFEELVQRELETLSILDGDD